MSHVFISYDHDDRNYVQRLCDDFRKRGFDPWIDEDIPYGDDWFRIIIEKIRNCDALVVVMTPEANQSEWVELEFMHARDNKKPIFPILLRGPCMDLLLNKQYTELTKTNDYLPSPNFYRDLGQVVQRIPNYSPEEIDAGIKEQTEKFQKRSEPGNFQIEPPVNLEPDPAVYDEIAKWEHYANEGETDFYGIAMLALALESQGTHRAHKQALNHLWRACKIDPIIKDKNYMTEHYGWTEEQNKILERLLTDRNFPY